MCFLFVAKHFANTESEEKTFESHSRDSLN